MLDDPPTNFGVCCPTQGSSVPTCNLSVSGTDAGTVTMDAAEEASVDAGSEPVEDAPAEGGATDIDLGHVERALAVRLGERQAVDAIEGDIDRIVAAARETARQAGLAPEALDALYFTGGSTGLRLLAQRIAAAFPGAQAVRGDRFASVASGLGVFARRWFGER